MKQKLIPVILTAALTSVTTLMVVNHYGDKVPYFTAAPAKQSSLVTYTSNNNNLPVGSINFENAAQDAVKAVVHIKTITSARSVLANGNDMFSQLFGPKQYYSPQQSGSGSGVVISPDGYVVTNNHVISDATEVTVTFNDRYTAKAKLIGSDPATDIAVLKVEGEKNMPFMEFGNSDDAKLGQWVLAVGYPLSLDATVTAGIISAKSRSLGINNTDKGSGVESFIQTDAAVNPGNSGGALVSTNGQLIGINSAIASPTGSYAGYSYAIPANIVRKVVNDLMKYGNVQMPFMGVEYLDGKTASREDVAKYGLDRKDGVYVMVVRPNSGAQKAGLAPGDFITQINGQPVNNKSEVQGQIARFQPGDNVSVNYERDGKSYSCTVQLTNRNMTTDIVRADNGVVLLGATFRPLSDKEKNSYHVSGGLMVTDIGKGLMAKQTQIRKGFVITGINDTPVKSIGDLENAMGGSKPVQIGGFYPGNQGMYYYGINTSTAKGANE